MLANGSNSLLLLDELRALGECEVKVHTEARPSLKDIDPRDCHFSEGLAPFLIADARARFWPDLSAADPMSAKRETVVHGAGP